MRRFADLFTALDGTTKTNAKIAAIADYFATATHADAAWATFFLSGGKLKQLVPTRHLRAWAAQAAGIPDWLLDESYQAVGDLAETLSLIVPPGNATEELALAEWIELRLKPLRAMPTEQQHAAVQQIWLESPIALRLVIMKLITGAFRVGVSGGLVTKAIARQFELPVEAVAHRLMGNWEPTPSSFANVVAPADENVLVPSAPYPFCLAHAVDIDKPLEALGCIDAFMAEWKWDGIRGQLIRRVGRTYLWSRGEELMESRWPEIEMAAAHVPDGTVLDGEILAVNEDGQVLPFAQLQRRIARKTVAKKLLREVPVVFHAFDILEFAGEDVRRQPLETRREILENSVRACQNQALRVTDLIESKDWEELGRVRDRSREHAAEGLMLKRRDAEYATGRVRGVWWKWKVEPHTIDAVLIYAQQGHGRRANLYTDYTFALWQAGQLVPFAKAYSGLSDAEIRKVDRFVRENTSETFGPVRSVKPQLVMELAFEGLQRSRRHKSGVATRFPRIVRWRYDKRPEDANHLSELLNLLPPESDAGT